MVTRLLFFPSLGRRFGHHVIGSSKVHSVSVGAGASSGWNMAVDHKPPPMGIFLFFFDSSMKRLSFLPVFPDFLQPDHLPGSSLHQYYTVPIYLSVETIPLIPFGIPLTQGSRGPGALANQPS